MVQNGRCRMYWCIHSWLQPFKIFNWSMRRWNEERCDWWVMLLHQRSDDIKTKKAQINTFFISKQFIYFECVFGLWFYILLSTSRAKKLSNPVKYEMQQVVHWKPQKLRRCAYTVSRSWYCLHWSVYSWL